jgi:hypothetical protein
MMPEETFAELMKCEYVLVNYVPSALRQCGCAIGLILFEPNDQRVRCSFTREWRRVRCLDPDADLSLLVNIAEQFENLAGQDAPELHHALDRMRSEFSGSIQVSRPRGVLTVQPEQEFDRLFRQYVAPLHSSREKPAPREGARPWIHAQLCDALRARSLWELLARDLPVEEFTAPGDGFRIDFAYRPNGVTNYVHAIALDRDWNHAKVLSYTFWRIRQKTAASMTAVVAGMDEIRASSHDAATQRFSHSAESCRQLLSDAGILIQPLSGLDGYLQSVARELRVN